MKFPFLLNFGCMCLLLISFLLPAQSQEPKLQDQKLASLGDFKLQSGEVIKDCRIGYRVFGKLNAQRTNVIVWPTWLLGRSEDIGQSVGPGRLLDPEQDMVVAIDSLGNGISSSPSNSASQGRMSFPKFTVRDMVAAEHELLTRQLGFPHIHAIIGQSLGGFQAYQWMVDYPLFMDEVVTIMGTPRIAPSDMLWTSIEADSIRQEKDWNDGNYVSEPALTTARYMHLFVMGTPNELNSNIKPHETLTALQQDSRFGDRWDANDWLYQIQAAQTMDIFGSEPISNVAGKIKCKVLIINGTQDLAVNASPSIEFAHALGVVPILLTGPCGHLAAGCEADKVFPQIRQFLGARSY